MIDLLTSKNRWPNPEDSIGIWCRKMGIYDCYEATGPRETFECLAKEIKEYLERHSDPILHTVKWSMFMIGKSKSTARPTIMFICKEAEARKTVRKMICNSGIINKYPGVKTGESTLSPDFDQLIPLASSPNDADVEPSGAEADQSVLCTTTELLFGSKIYANDNTRHSNMPQQATAGGLLRWQGRYFCLTVAHVFSRTTEFLHLTEPFEDCAFEFEIDEDNDTDEIEEELVEVTSRGSLTPELTASDHNDISGDDFSDISSQGHSAFYGSSIGDDLTFATMNTPTSVQISPVNVGSLTITSLNVVGKLFLTSSKGPQPNLDYGLFEVEKPDLTAIRKFMQEGNPENEVTYPDCVATGRPKDVEVIAVTGSAGRLGGRLCGTPTYMRLAQSKSFQEVWTVRLNGRLAKGDCGSWIFDSKTGELYGHIVAGSPDTGVAYIIPANQVFKDITRRLGGDVELVKGDASVSSTRKTEDLAALIADPVKAFLVSDHGRLLDSDPNSKYRYYKGPLQNPERNLGDGECLSEDLVELNMLCAPSNPVSPHRSHNLLYRGDVRSRHYRCGTP
jgi:peptide-N4-(N-acetyl-beta-glucosaminyl)asparagine amidase